MDNVGIKELVDMVYDVATKTEESTAKKVLSLLIAGYKALDNDTKPIKSKTVQQTQSREINEEVVKNTMKKSNGKRRKISSRHKWSKTELSILRSPNLSRIAKIKELQKLGRSKQAVIAKAWATRITL